jgi:hypothetical protein
MEEEAPTMWSYVFLFVITLMGIGAGMFCSNAIAAAVGLHLGGLRGAQALSMEYGQQVAGQITSAYTGGDLLQQGTGSWSESITGRYMHNSLRYDPHLGWLMSGLSPQITAGSSGRLEKFYPGRPGTYE